MKSAFDSMEYIDQPDGLDVLYYELDGLVRRGVIRLHRTHAQIMIETRSGDEYGQDIIFSERIGRENAITIPKYRAKVLETAKNKIKTMFIQSESL